METDFSSIRRKTVSEAFWDVSMYILPKKLKTAPWNRFRGAMNHAAKKLYTP